MTTLHSNILKRPRITEKGAISAEANGYIFDIHKEATKAQVMKAVEEIYKVVPVKVNVLAIKSKAKFVRGKKGRTAGGKKAYVFLKKGDQIQII